MASQQTNIDTVVLDVDGTLVDTVYQHTVMWAQAFASVDVDVPCGSCTAPSGWAATGW